MGLYLSNLVVFPKRYDRFALQVPQQPRGRKSFSIIKFGKKWEIIKSITRAVSAASVLLASPFLRQKNNTLFHNRHGLCHRFSSFSKIHEI